MMHTCLYKRDLRIVEKALNSGRRNRLAGEVQRESLLVYDTLMVLGFLKS